MLQDRKGESLRTINGTGFFEKTGPINFNLKFYS